MLLESQSVSNCSQRTLQFSDIDDLLHKIKDRDAIAYWREQAGAIGSKEQVALAVDRPQKIGELNAELDSTFSRNRGSYQP